MPEIDPNRPPLSSNELAADADALGLEREAPPLVEAQEPATGGADRVASDITLLPPG